MAHKSVFSYKIRKGSSFQEAFYQNTLCLKRNELPFYYFFTITTSLFIYDAKLRTKFAWCRSADLFKNAGKILHIRKSKTVRDLCHRVIGIGQYKYTENLLHLIRYLHNPAHLIQPELSG